MELMLLIGAGAAVLFCIWFIIKVSVGYVVPPEKSGLAFLKQELRKIGVDVGAIPDNALIEIVDACLSGAQLVASVSSNPKDAAWRANFIDQLRVHAEFIRTSIEINQQRSKGGIAEQIFRDENVDNILRQHGVIR